jgi:hypothetical protein
MANATEELLKQLGWPEPHMADKGRLQWSRQGTDDSVDAAIVLVTPTQVRARMARMRLDGPDPLHMEAIWDIGPNQEPRMKSFVYGGEQQPMDQGRAVQQFNDLRNLLNARAAFQTMGTRWKLSTPKPAGV